MFAVALKPLGVMRMTGTCAGTPPLEWTYRTSPPPGMTRAELHFKDVTTNSLVAGVLILSPGMNGDGLRLLKDDNWCKLEEFFRKYVESLEYADVDGAWINVHLGREEELSFVRRGSPAPLVGYPKGHCFQTGRRLGGCNEVEVDDTLSSNMA